MIELRGTSLIIGDTGIAASLVCMTDHSKEGLEE